MTEDCDAPEDAGQELSISYDGAQETCPHCHGQEIDFLGNQTGDKYALGKSWFQCRRDHMVFSTKPEAPPRYRYDGRR
jgi:hypothetical protein